MDNINFLKTLCFTLIILVASGGTVNAQWKTRKSVSNDFDAVKQSFASSKSVTSNKPMGPLYLYDDTEATLSIGCNSTDKWAYLHFTNEPNLLNTSLKDGYNSIQTRMKWDSNIENVSLIQTWGSSFLHFVDDNAIISKVLAHNEVMLELNWYANDTVYFTFSLAGSSAAVKKILSECESY